MRHDRRIPDMAHNPIGLPSSRPQRPVPRRRPELRLVKKSPREGAMDQDQFDAWMLAVACHQDRGAFERLFGHFAPRLKSWLIRTGSAPESVDDLVQDTFVLLWRKAEQFDPDRARVAAWLFTIARNLRIDRHRGAGAAWLALENAPLDELADPAVSAEDRLAQARISRDVRSALAQLNSEQRTLVQLSFYEDKSHSTIATELSLPLGTVKTRLRAAAARLRQLLEEFPL